MKPIVTLTVNPSIDGSAQTDVIRPIRKLRMTDERFDPGGGGINVARVIHVLGGATLAVYLSGGATGSVFDALLESAAIERRRIPIQEHTRISLTAYERSSGLEYRFVPQGPHISEAELRACLDALEDMDHEYDYFVASGSLPPGIPDDFYAVVAEIVGRKGARLVLDTSGKALGAALKHGVYLVKPSLGEFEGLLERNLSEPARQETAARELVRSGAAKLVALTLGRNGALLATERGVLRLAAPSVTAKSAVGAGDSFVAAMTFALAQGRAPEDALAFGIAAGTAAVLSPGTGLCRREDVDRLYAQIKENAPATALT